MAEITRVGPDGWQEYRRIRLASLADAPYAFASTLERERRFADGVWRQRLGSSTAATFLARRDGDPIGTATGKPENPADEFGVPGAWQLVGMWVDPAGRGLGIADALVEAVVEHARTVGALAVVLWVTDVNDRARNFYKRMGFVPTGARQPVRPGEPDSWEQQMIRRLC